LDVSFRESGRATCRGGTLSTTLKRGSPLGRKSTLFQGGRIGERIFSPTISPVELAGGKDRICFRGLSTQQLRGGSTNKHLAGEEKKKESSSRKRGGEAGEQGLYQLTEEEGTREKGALLASDKRDFLGRRLRRGGNLPFEKVSWIYIMEKGPGVRKPPCSKPRPRKSAVRKRNRLIHGGSRSTTGGSHERKGRMSERD